MAELFDARVRRPLRASSFLWVVSQLERSVRALALGPEETLLVIVTPKMAEWCASRVKLAGVEVLSDAFRGGNTRVASGVAAGGQPLFRRFGVGPSCVETATSRTTGQFFEGEGRLRIRTIKPEFWSHRKLKHEPPGVQLLAVGLISMADDEGYFWAGVDDVRDAIRPGERVLPRVERDLRRLVALNYLVIFDTDEGPLGFLPTFLDHQVISRPKPSKLKRYRPKESMIDHGLIPDESTQEGKGTGKGSGIRDQGSAATLETPEEKTPMKVQRPQSAHQRDNPGVAGWYEFQKRRKAKGYTIERPLNTSPQSLDELWSMWLALREKSDSGEAHEERLWLAVDKFMADPYWKPKEYPWHAFLKQAIEYINAVKVQH